MTALVILAIVLLICFYIIQRSKVQTPISKDTESRYKEILQQEVSYYEHLSPEEKKLFEKRVNLFLSHKTITGVDVDVDDITKVLVAASAVIPAFAFTDYNYPNIREVLLYSNTFDDSFLHPNREKKQDRISGMVGSGPLSQVVMLSKPNLIDDFKNTKQHQNVGIHEFTHLLDKTDGIVDGIPNHLLPQKNISAWISEMHKEVKKIKTGESDLSPYALTNDAEFFAVASEYFFVSPTEFKKKHPELLAYFQTIFQQEVTEDGLDPIEE